MTAARPNRQLERSERSTEALPEAASQLIGDGGFSAMTFPAIGERAGYPRCLVTAPYRFEGGTREALLQRIVDRWSHQRLIDPERSQPGPAFAYLAGTIRARLGSTQGETK